MYVKHSCVPIINLQWQVRHCTTSNIPPEEIKLIQSLLIRTSCNNSLSCGKSHRRNLEADCVQHIFFQLISVHNKQHPFQGKGTQYHKIKSSEKLQDILRHNSNDCCRPPHLCSKIYPNKLLDSRYTRPLLKIQISIVKYYSGLESASNCYTFFAGRF